jgi:spore maturation protein CgeB
MKLVIFGLTVSSSWGNGHATLWRALVRAFAARGHRVLFYERDVPYYAAHRDLVDLPGGTLRLYPSWDDVRHEAERELTDADVAMVTSYCPDGAAATELALASGAAARVFYDLDTPVTLERLERGEPVPYLGPTGLAGFDLVLSYTGGAALDALRTRLGARHTATLYGSVDPETHRPAPPAPAFTADVSYLGTYAADRQEALGTLFIEPARRLPERTFLIGGAQYPADFPWTSNIHFVRHVAPYDHPAFFSSSPLTVNVTRRAMAAMGYCPSGRLFEAAACDTAVLSDWWQGLDEFFEPEREILIARTTDEAVAAAELPREALRRVGRAARDRALGQHTAAHRAAELEAALEGAARAAAAAPAAAHH